MDRLTSDPHRQSTSERTELLKGWQEAFAARATRLARLAAATALVVQLVAAEALEAQPVDAEASVEQGRLEERQRTQALVTELQEERKHVAKADALRRAIVSGEARELREMSAVLRRWYTAAFARGWGPAIDEARRLQGADREAGKLGKRLLRPL